MTLPTPSRDPLWAASKRARSRPARDVSAGQVSNSASNSSVTDLGPRYRSEGALGEIVEAFSVEDLPALDRSKVSVNPRSGCWEWTAAIQKDGYGQVKRAGRCQKAHRYVYERLVGPIEVGVQQLDHLCRVRHCVNPAHLEPVTPMENVRRGLPAVPAEVPSDLYRSLARLLERAYKAGWLDGRSQLKP